MTTARHRLRQLRRDLHRAGLGHIGRRCRSGPHGRTAFALPYALDRDTLSKVQAIAHERWPGWVEPDVTDVYWHYYSAPIGQPRSFAPVLAEIEAASG